MCLATRVISILTFCLCLNLSLIVHPVTAVDIHAQARQSCATGTPIIGTCNGIRTNVCCVFPNGGILAQGVYFSVIPDCSVGRWYYRSNANAGCASVRDQRYGYERFACMTGGASAGGGAAWFDIVQNICNSKLKVKGRGDGEVVERDVELDAAVGNCTSTVQATVLAFEGEGAWVVEPGSEEWEVYDQLPETEDLDEHLLNMQKIGTWYDSYDDHPAAAAAKRSELGAEG
ncbi:hypothetical protein IFR05_015287 [Cadophora sp. M221]|nr:hypothetical protein IFR05_015287 [Cadophora sp. M221]